MVEWGMKENDGGGELNYDILQELYKYHNVPSVHNNKNKI
jgi:hypothetical protein